MILVDCPDLWGISEARCVLGALTHGRVPRSKIILPQNCTILDWVQQVEPGYSFTEDGFFENQTFASQCYQ
ncbi:Alpha-N-acetylglucosaminidase [Dissostichus eleginoides]|uniref:Alpha-N-acetylglucosaminidase n=1 Tax=Dissostichus eleginoides TaxID=100907 RepID=A0AAD9BDL7_DISEL|nr:Alpha-N-acetylglucosaminidase [Dissostichus eleginoides]